MSREGIIREAEPRGTGVTRPRIVGLLGSGMLDWPGKVSATVFVSGCPLRCPYCHNPALINATRPEIEVSAIVKHLRDKRGWLDGVVVTGGEPTSDPGLRTLLKALHAEKVPVKLDTNGTNPDLLSELIADSLVDFVALDVKALPENYDRACGRSDIWTRVRNTIDCILESGVDHEFRTTVFPDAVHPDDLPLIAALLAGGRRYAIQQFRPATTLEPAAATARAYRREALQDAAQQCAAYLPTIVRGA